MPSVRFVRLLSFGPREERHGSYGNRSDHYQIQNDTDCQSVLMSIFSTLKQRGQDPIRTLIDATKQYPKTHILPTLLQRITPDG